MAAAGQELRFADLISTGIGLAPGSSVVSFREPDIHRCYRGFAKHCVSPRLPLIRVRLHESAHELQRFRRYCSDWDVLNFAFAALGEMRTHFLHEFAGCIRSNSCGIGAGIVRPTLADLEAENS